MAKNSLNIKIKLIELHAEAFKDRLCCYCKSDISNMGHRAVACSKKCKAEARAAAGKSARRKILNPKCKICEIALPENRGNRAENCGTVACVREQNWQRNLFRIYHIRAAEFYDRLLQQNSQCAICKRDLAASLENDKSQLNVDHDHSCCPGRIGCGNCIRGILCNGCNGGMGLFNDNPENLIAAADYLIRFKEKGA